MLRRETKSISFKEKQSFPFSTRLLTWVVSTFERQISCRTRVTGNRIFALKTQPTWDPFHLSIGRSFFFCEKGIAYGVTFLKCRHTSMSFKTRLFHAPLLPRKCNLSGVDGNFEHFLCMYEFLGFQLMASIPTVVIMIRGEKSEHLSMGLWPAYAAQHLSLLLHHLDSAHRGHLDKRNHLPGVPVRLRCISSCPEAHAWPTPAPCG